MKPNRTLLSLLLVLLMLLTTACGSAAGNTEAAAQAVNYDATVDAIAEETAAEPAEAPEPAPSAQALGQGVLDGSVNLSEKIIYSAQAQIETLDFDASTAAVQSLMEQYNAFLESSSVSGGHLGSDPSSSLRWASYILRVPREYYGAMTGDLDTVGSVISLTSYADNITAQYTDTESRLQTYEIEEQRLLDILAQAESVEDMIQLESRISDVRYQKESLTAQLQNWDNQVSYSTVDIFIQEVQVLTPEPEAEKSYWQQVGDGFLSTLRAMGRTGKTLLRLLVAALPVLVLVALVVLAVVLTVRRRKKAAQTTPHSDRKEEPHEEH